MRDGGSLASELKQQYLWHEVYQFLHWKQASANLMVDGKDSNPKMAPGKSTTRGTLSASAGVGLMLFAWCLLCSCFRVNHHLFNCTCSMVICIKCLRTNLTLLLFSVAFVYVIVKGTYLLQSQILFLVCLYEVSKFWIMVFGQSHFYYSLCCGWIHSHLHYFL